MLSMVEYRLSLYDNLPNIKKYGTFIFFNTGQYISGWTFQNATPPIVIFFHLISATFHDDFGYNGGIRATTFLCSWPFL